MGLRPRRFRIRRQSAAKRLPKCLDQSPLVDGEMCLLDVVAGVPWRPGPPRPLSVLPASIEVCTLRTTV
jgi:hypothetical protein